MVPWCLLCQQLKKGDHKNTNINKKKWYTEAVFCALKSLYYKKRDTFCLPQRVPDKCFFWNSIMETNSSGKNDIYTEAEHTV